MNYQQWVVDFRNCHSSTVLVCELVMVPLYVLKFGFVVCDGHINYRIPRDNGGFEGGVKSIRGIRHYRLVDDIEYDCRLSLLTSHSHT